MAPVRTRSAGSLAATFDLTVLGNSAPGGLEYVALAFSNPTNAVLSWAMGFGVITN